MVLIEESVLFCYTVSKEYEEKGDGAMNILITNDDGIDNIRIAKLAEIASRMGDVYVVAPDCQKSAVSHALTIRTHLILKKVDFPVAVAAAYSLSGTPCDCVKTAMSCKLADHYDLVLSGINEGPNMGADTLYSGTVAAALEGACWGIPSFAVSMMGEDFSAVDDYLYDILMEYKDKSVTPRGIWNINFPDSSLQVVKGGKETVPDIISAVQEDYKMISIGEDEWDIEPAIQMTKKFAQGSDFEAVHKGYISIEPLHLMV